MQKSLFVGLILAAMLTVACTSNTGEESSGSGDKKDAAFSTHFVEVTTIANVGHRTADGLSVSPTGEFYVSGGHAAKNIVKIAADGTNSVFASGFTTANGSDFDSRGNLFLAAYRDDTVFRISPDGEVSKFAEDLNGPAGIYVDTEDNVYVGLFGRYMSGTAATVLKFNSAGLLVEEFTGGGLRDVVGVTGDDRGNVWAGNWAGGVLYRIAPGPITMLVDLPGSLNHIRYSDGNIYVPSPTTNSIFVVATDGTFEVAAGTQGRQSRDGAPGEAVFQRPNSAAFSPDGNILYVMDADTGDLRALALNRAP